VCLAKKLWETRALPGRPGTVKKRVRDEWGFSGHVLACVKNTESHISSVEECVQIDQFMTTTLMPPYGLYMRNVILILHL